MCGKSCSLSLFHRSSNKWDVTEESGLLVQVVGVFKNQPPQVVLTMRILNYRRAMLLKIFLK